MQAYNFYIKRTNEVTNQLRKNEELIFRLSLLRLGLFIVAIAVLIYTFKIDLRLFGVFLVIFITSFLYLVKLFLSKNEEKFRLENILSFYQNELNIGDGKLNLCFDGEGEAGPYHDYAHDLDIIGKSSVYQRLNRCQTLHGNKLLLDCFLVSSSLNTIQKRQEAVEEISDKGLWREDFFGSLFGLNQDHRRDVSKELSDSLSVDFDFFTTWKIGLVVWSVPLIWIVLFSLYFFVDIRFQPALIAFGFVLIGWYFSKAKSIGNIQSKLTKALENIHPYQNALNHIFGQKWQASLLKEKIQKYTNSDNSLAVEELSSIKKLVDLLDYRLNMIVGILLNLFLLWDFRVVRNIAEWKKDNHHKIPDLFSVIGLFEAMGSLAIWKYNNQYAVFPVITEGEFHLDAIDVKHPLIDDKVNVGNDFSLLPQEFISIVTGSNMAGKSTFLRAIGVNIVLGNAGTVCFAKKLTYSHMKLMSYMRIKDSLEENASTFKAELNRIQQMLKVLHSKTPYLLLIDEMLRGTNSKDKLKGSLAITKKILDSKTHAIIATHDLALTDIQKTAPNEVSNYFFDIDFVDGELQFDYKIKAGVCQNFNASYLLEKIGIS